MTLTFFQEFLRVALDFSPIIALTRLGVLDEALNLFNELEVPSGVLEKLGKERDRVYQELMKVINEGKICVENINRRFPKLGVGESSAIALALALTKGKIVVLDDRKARRLARELGLKVMSMLSMLKKLYEYENGVLMQTPNLLYKCLLEIGFYIDRKLFERIFLEQ